MPTAFITGCASGFGHALARRMLGEGWRVVASDPEVIGLEARLLTSADARDRLFVVRMDVSDAPGVRAAIWEALEWSPVDVLVNNAGYAVFATQEEADLLAVERMLDVNVMGALRVTRALLPTLRARAGTVVQISSVAGRMAFPESGFYAASKYALEAISEALFAETCSFGVKVRVVEPGAHDTMFQQRAREASPPRRTSSPYAALHPLWDARKQAVLEPPADPEQVVDAILASLRDDRPFLRVPVGADATRILSLRDALTPDAWVTLMGRRSGLPAGYSGKGEVLSPQEVLGLPGDAPPERIAPTLAALRHGHLEHWEHEDEGKQALEALRSRA